MVSWSVLLALRIEHVQVAGLLEHHRAAAGVERLHVVVDELGPLRQRLGVGVVRPHVGDAVAIGNEIDRVAEPRRIDVLRIGPRRRDQVERLEIDDPDRTVLAAAIVAALLVPRRVHAIGDAAAIRRDLSLIPARQRHRLRDAALGRHRPEARRRIRRRRSARPDANMIFAPSGVQPCTVSAPGCHVSRAGSPPLDRHGVDIGVAGVVGAERDGACRRARSSDCSTGPGSWSAAARRRLSRSTIQMLFAYANATCVALIDGVRNRRVGVPCAASSTNPGTSTVARRAHAIGSFMSPPRVG